MPVQPPEKKRPPSFEEAFEISLEVSRRVFGRFFDRHGRLPTEAELTAALHLSGGHQRQPKRKLADPDRQNLRDVVAGAAVAEVAPHEHQPAPEPRQGWLRTLLDMVLEP